MADLSQVKPEDIREFAVGSFPADLGIEPLEIEDDHARGRITVESRHLHPGGFVHGGVWTALGDTVAAWATFLRDPARLRLHHDRAEAQRLRCWPPR